MSYSTFRLGANDATKEPMFLGSLSTLRATISRSTAISKS